MRRGGCPSTRTAACAGRHGGRIDSTVDVRRPVARRASEQGETAAREPVLVGRRGRRLPGEHGAFLGDADFVWGPEGLSEADAGLLGDVAGRRVLEVGAGAAQCSRWLAAQGAQPVALDLSGEMLRRGRELGAAAGLAVPLVQADAARLPFAAGSFDARLLGLRRRCRSSPTPPR